MRREQLDFIVKSPYKNLLRFKSHNRKNWFAPEFDIPIWESSINTKFIEKIHKILKKDKFYHHGSRLNGFWKTYNFFSKNYSFIANLKNKIKKEVVRYLKSLDKDYIDPFYINGWVYPMKENTELPLHIHAFHEHSFISGQIMLSSSKLPVGFVLPHLSIEYGVLYRENQQGGLRLFPSYLPHMVPKLTQKERWTLAFDIFTKDFIHLFKKKIKDTQDPVSRAIKL